MLGKNYGTFGTNLILNKTFQAFWLYISAMRYLKDEARALKTSLVRTI